jgi:hypothetical protein
LVATNPEPHQKYLVLTGERAGWVLPGNMLRTTQRDSWSARRITEPVVLVNTLARPDDQIIPLKMNESQVRVRRVGQVITEPRTRLRDRESTDVYDDWVALPGGIPDEDLELLRYQIREHLLLAGYERESQRRGWHDYWRRVLESAGFTPRPVPTVLSVQAKWRIDPYRLDTMLAADFYRDLQRGSEGIALSTVTTTHTVLLPNHTAECTCTARARLYQKDQEINAGEQFNTIRDAVRVGMKSQMNLVNVVVRSVTCAYGYSS